MKKAGIQELIQKYNFKYEIFTDDNGKNITINVLEDVLMTGNIELTDLFLFYSFLTDLRIMNGTDEKHPITHDNLWPKINRTQTIIKNYLINSSDKEYKYMIEFLTGEFLSKVNEYKDSLLNEYKLKKGKMNSSQRSLIELEYRNNTKTIIDNLIYLENLRPLELSLKQLDMLKEHLLKVELLKKEEMRYKFNFYLSLLLALFSIILSIIMYYFPKK